MSNMDLGTILLILSAAVGTTDIVLMLLGPRIRNYETISMMMVSIATLSALGALLYMASLI
ncbi:MAG: hypothetical protein ACFFD6_04385, partial [Candidatus Thorarchaeota archaeon]